MDAEHLGRKHYGLKRMSAVVGLASLAWFLFRVVPKPSRAAYPCQRAAAPLASGFIIWLAGLISLRALHRRARELSRRHRWAAAAAALALAVTAVWLPLGLTMDATAQEAFTPSDPPNQPMGAGKGIHPGRVVWAYAPEATRWDGQTGQWWDDANTDPSRVDQMVSGSLRSLAGQRTDKQAWDALFRHFNETRGLGKNGYRRGEKIAVKINANQDRSAEWGAARGMPSPHVVYAVVAQLVGAAGVPAEDITIYDASRYIGDPIFKKVRAGFPGVQFVVAPGMAKEGRIAAAPDPANPVHFADPAVPAAQLPQCVTAAKYLINLALLRPHTLFGVTLTAKNHFGSTYFPDSGRWTPQPLHSYGSRNRPMGSYHCLVDLIGHRHLGGKTVLYLLDGLYTAEHNEGRVFRFASFGDRWAASLLASQDPVAIDSVALDLLRSEPRATQVRGNPDNYLHEAALANQPPSGMVYDPERDGQPLASLGVHEHWNNASDKQYSRNLRKKEGIELVRWPEAQAAQAPAGPGAEVKISGERRIRFTDDWRFFKGDAGGAEQPSFDDSGWRRLELPHDWAIEGPFDRKYNPHSGALPFFGVGWYRRKFTLTGNTAGRYFSIEFDGAMANSRVWLNGQELGGRPYGYIGFSFDLTPHLKSGGQENVLAVRLAPEDRSSRWYPGAGIYRNVWLEVTGPVHVARWGTYVTTAEEAGGRSAVTVKTEIRNRGAAPAKVVLQSVILDPSGRPVTRSGQSVEIPAAGLEAVTTRLTVEKPQKWDVDQPRLYTLVSEVLEGRRMVDRYTTPFGIRTIAFDQAKGFLLNGRVLKMRGVCLHHDLGALGAAVNRRATERQLEIMKAMGVNAVRTSHNPPSPELLEFCDRLGLLVMDEAFDVWRRPKLPNDYSKHFDEWSERDVRDMVRRDRNHPSVILWSIGNEIGEQRLPGGAQEAERLTRFLHQEDPTRPVTAGFNIVDGAIQNGLAAKVDIPGFNYKPANYAQVLKDHPDWIIVGAETSSCVSSRGVYHLPLEKYQKHESLQLTSYDLIAPDWAYIPDVEFDAQEKFPNVLGEFVWTGFDYLGEPTPYFLGRGTTTDKDWPARSSYFGTVDLAGFPKDRYFLYQSVWTKTPMVHLLPHWNWEGREGQAIPVMTYTNADEVELFLNGKSLGKKKRWSEPVELPVGKNVSPDLKFRSKYRLLWQVPYAPGAIKAVAYGNGAPVASKEIRTAGPPARVRLAPDRAQIRADGDDLCFVTVRIEDPGGNLCPKADNLVRFRLEGPARIAAVDNGNPATVEPFQADYRKAFNGLALLIVRSERGKPGSVRVTATSEGLAPGTAALATK